MRDKSKGDIPKQLGDWLKNAGTRARGSLKRGISENLGDFDLRKVDLKNVSEYSPWFRMGLLVLGLWFSANLVSRIIGLVARPVYTSLPKRSGGVAQTSVSGESYDSILHRNIFNVEGKIPDPFDQGRLDCFSQARPTTERIQLLGTIVMNDDKLSTALVEEEGSGEKIGVRKDDPFFGGKYVAMKVERKKLCFQVRSTQDFEFVDIPDESSGLGLSAAPALSTGDGIVAKSENEFEVKKSFLDKSLMNLTELLQTARAVPYNDESGKMKGFLIQSIDPSSPFAQLGLHQGDVLTSVNNIPLDNPGRGLEAFQMLRNASAVHLSVIRGGQQMNLSYNLGG